ncbi:hypothetical protein GGER_17080 [Serratia rubidaea]
MSKPVIAIHGGAGAISRAAMNAEKEQQYIQALSSVVEAGQAVLAGGGSALDAVTEAVRLLEECPLFNAGKGAVFTHQGTHELDACVMDGRGCDAGAVAGVSRVRNPVLAARAVLERSPHVMFACEGAEKFAAAHGLEMVEPDFFLPRNASINCTAPRRSTDGCCSIMTARRRCMTILSIPIANLAPSARWRWTPPAIWRRPPRPAA